MVIAAAILGGFLVLLVVLVVGIGIVFFDLTGYREQRAEWFQMKILEQFSHDTRLASLGLLPVVQVPPTGHPGFRVEVSGRVPSADVGDVGLEAVQVLGRKLNVAVEIDDRLQVVPEAPAHDPVAA